MMNSDCIASCKEIRSRTYMLLKDFHIIITIRISRMICWFDRILFDLAIQCVVSLINYNIQVWVVYGESSFMYNINEKMKLSYSFLLSVAPEFPQSNCVLCALFDQRPVTSWHTAQKRGSIICAIVVAVTCVVYVVHIMYVYKCVRALVHTHTYIAHLYTHV